MVNALIDPKKKEQVQRALARGDFEGIFSKDKPSAFQRGKEKGEDGKLAADKVSPAPLPVTEPIKAPHWPQPPPFMVNSSRGPQGVFMGPGPKPYVPSVAPAPSQTQLDRDLLVAVYDGDIHAFDLALKAGADANARNGRGDTALIIATEKQHFIFFGDLVAHGADLNAQNSDGQTALMFAIENNDINWVSKLLEKAPTY